MDFVHIYKPGKSPVTVLALHGSGGDENDLLPIAAGLAPGAAVLSPRGSVFQHGSCRFFAFPGEKGFDPEEVRTRSEELAQWVRRMIQHHGIDPARLYALGFSNGANIAAVTLLQHPGLLQGACLLRARLVVPAPLLPDLAGAPVLISAGQHDHLIPAADAETLSRTLSSAGAKVDYIVQNAGHELTPADFSLARQWFARLL